jgi:hypothetical protein
MLSALIAVGLAYAATLTIDSLIIKLILKIIIAVAVYYLIMRFGHAKIQRDCLNYVFHRKGH